MQKSFFIPEPKLIARYGFSSSYPASTLPAFEKAVEAGCDIIEVCIMSSRDNKLVVIHNNNLNTVSDGHGTVSDYSYDEIMALDAGHRFTPDEGKTYPFRGTGLTFLTLDELLAKFPKQRFYINLNIINVKQADRFIKLITDTKAQNRVFTTSQKGGILKWIRKVKPDMATGFSGGELFFFYFLVKTGFLFLRKRFRGDAVYIAETSGPSRLANQGTIRLAHERKLRVYVSTENNRVQMLRALESGADGIAATDCILLKSLTDS